MASEKFPVQDGEAREADEEVRKRVRALLSDNKGMEYKDALKQCFRDDPALRTQYLLAHDSFVPQ